MDFALEAMHVVQLQSVSGGAPNVRARATVPFDAPRSEVLASAPRFRALVKRALALGEFNGRKAVLAVPSGSFRTVSINYQTSGDTDDDAAILHKMRDRVEGNLSDYVLDYLPVKSCSKLNEKLALVAVSEREKIVTLLESARSARLDVEALEIGPVAIGRLVGAMSNINHNGNVLVINSGREASYLTLISGTDLLFDQQVSFGENGLIQQLAETLDMSDAMARELISRAGLMTDPASQTQAIDESGLLSTMSEILKPQFARLAEEIKRVCLYAAAETRGGSVSQVYLLGSIARWPGSDDLLGSLTDVSIAKIPDPLAPFVVANESSIATPAAPEIAVATGLALRGLQVHG